MLLAVWDACSAQVLLPTAKCVIMLTSSTKLLVYRISVRSVICKLHIYKEPPAPNVARTVPAAKIQLITALHVQRTSTCMSATTPVATAKMKWGCTKTRRPIPPNCCAARVFPSVPRAQTPEFVTLASRVCISMPTSPARFALLRMKPSLERVVSTVIRAASLVKVRCKQIV